MATPDASMPDGSDTTPSFQYQPLAPGQIRLLQLTCCDSELRCTLIPVSISSHPVYAALSYTWGKPEPYHKLFVDGHDSILKIQNNLAAALRHFPSYIGKYLWIDAVCINQEDNAEKSDQVARMAQIYQQAEEVVSWLGKEEGGSNLAMESIERYGGAAFGAGILSVPPSFWKTWPEVADVPELQETKRRIFELFSTAAAAEKTNGPEAFDRIEFAILTNRPYFARLWIKQEVALARKIRLVCGTRTTSFEHLASAYLFIVIYEVWQCTQSQEGWLTSPPKHLIMVEGELGWEVENIAQPSDAIGPLMSLRRRLHQEKTRPALFWLLKAFHMDNQRFNSMCMDPRDKIFGLLGLVEDGTPIQSLINYSVPVESIYEAVARSLFRDGIIDTLLFCRAKPSPNLAKPSPNLAKPSPNLPSWVPDWDRDERNSTPKLPMPYPWGNDGIYQASGEKRQPCNLNTRPVQAGILVLDGTLVGEVGAVGTVWNEKSPNSPFQFWFDVLGAQRMFAEVKSLLEDSTYTAHDKIEASWRIPIGDKELNSDTHQWQRVTSERSQGMHQRITAAQGPRLKGDDIRETHSYQSIMQGTHDARPFLLKGGKENLDNYVGLCPAETRPGDVVAILFGATVPFVLRPRPVASEGGFTLVGETYVYGIMDGEYVQGDCDTKEFILF